MRLSPLASLSKGNLGYVNYLNLTFTKQISNPLVSTNQGIVSSMAKNVDSSDFRTEILSSNNEFHLQFLGHPVVHWDKVRTRFLLDDFLHVCSVAKAVICPPRIGKKLNKAIFFLT